MRAFAMFFAVAGCTATSADERTVRNDAQTEPPRAFECSGRHSETVSYPGQVIRSDHHFAAIGRLNPADAPRATAWLCDFSCEAGTCACPEGASCSSVGEEVEPESDGWCTTATIVVRPDGQAMVPCGVVTTYDTEGTLTRYGTHGARVYVRLD